MEASKEVGGGEQGSEPLAASVPSGPEAFAQVSDQGGHEDNDVTYPPPLIQKYNFSTRS